jgi:endonuclease/exonuclease/phosphatase family metal-dependent hydrolase
MVYLQAITQTKIMLMNKLLFSLSMLFLFILPGGLFAQKNYTIATVGFYNVENLFDTLDTPGVNDTEFSPEGSKLWNAARYEHKLGNLARVIDELGTNQNREGITLLGLAEVENRNVLEDLVNMPMIREKNYRIVHFDSPDRRGIDVALLYQSGRFTLLDAEPLEVDIYDGTRKVFTREALYVKGLLDGEEIHVMVNHWPSRRGGESRTAPWREAGARVCRNVVDSLTRIDPNAKIVIMGDLNDNPTDSSVKNVLQARTRKNEVQPGGLYNAVAHYYQRGIGSNAWRDTWSLFDQVIISYGLLQESAGGYYFHRSFVHNKKYLRQKQGHFKGYPFRSFGGDEYLGGYSDHFPVYIHLIKPL